jgi:hypothetical protein
MQLYVNILLMTDPEIRAKRIRVVDDSLEGKSLYDVSTMAMMTYSLPRPVEKAGSIVVYPGMGEPSRVADAVLNWEKSDAARHLLVAGVYDVEDTFEKLTVQRLSEEPYNLRREDGVVIQESANHTKDQAEWVARQVVEKKLASVALFAPAYHLLRAYATTVKSLKDAGVQIPLIPMPVRTSPSTQSSETGMDMWEMSPGEIQRIIKYQDKGDVATLTELKDYVNWSWDQPIYKD